MWKVRGKYYKGQKVLREPVEPAKGRIIKNLSDIFDGPINYRKHKKCNSQAENITAFRRFSEYTECPHSILTKSLKTFIFNRETHKFHQIQQKADFD